MIVCRQGHWRDGEEPDSLVEDAVAAEKSWGALESIAPVGEQSESYRAQLHLKTPDRRMERRGAFLLEAHQEKDLQIIIRLWQGNKLLRRAHIGKGHGEPDDGPVFSGPHIHFPTTVFAEIDGRRARTRVYGWSIPEGISFMEAIALFASEINLSVEIPEPEFRGEGQ